MKITKTSDEVFYAEGEIVAVPSSQITFLKDQTFSNLRKRARLCTHRDTTDRLHEMTIVNMRETYVRPHKNTNKPKSFLVLEGSMDVVVFSETGTVTEVVRLGAYNSGDPFYFRLHETRFHTLRITSDFVVFQETTVGPFQRGDTVFAAWAPEDAKIEACQSFLRRMDSDIEFVLATQTAARNNL